MMDDGRSFRPLIKEETALQVPAWTEVTYDEEPRRKTIIGDDDGRTGARQVIRVKTVDTEGIDVTLAAMSPPKTEEEEL